MLGSVAPSPGSPEFGDDPDRAKILLPLLLALLIMVFCLSILYSASGTRRVLTSSKSPAERSSYMLRFWVIGCGGGVGGLALFWLISNNSGSIVLDLVAVPVRLAGDGQVETPQAAQTSEVVSDALKDAEVLLEPFSAA